MEEKQEKNKSIFNIEIKFEYFEKYWDSFFVLLGKNILKIFEAIKIDWRKSGLSYEGVKIFAAGMLTAASIIWIGYYEFYSIAHSEPEIENAETKPEIDLEIEESKVNAEALNDYKFKLSEEQCEEDKEQKKSSELCGKDDEDELEKLENEMKIYTARKNYKPKPKGPMPYVFDKDSAGRRVCNKKNDHPGKSKQDKSKHMDMECCLDPDEYPNPNCYYNPEKYGKYL